MMFWMNSFGVVTSNDLPYTLIDSLPMFSNYSHTLMNSSSRNYWNCVERLNIWINRLWRWLINSLISSCWSNFFPWNILSTSDWIRLFFCISFDKLKTFSMRRIFRSSRLMSAGNKSLPYDITSEGPDPRSMISVVPSIMQLPSILLWTMVILSVTDVISKALLNSPSLISSSYMSNVLKMSLKIDISS